MLTSCRQNFLTGDHDSQILDFKAVTREDNAHDVLSNIVNIALYGGHHNSAS